MFKIGERLDFESAKRVTFANRFRTYASTGKGNSGFERASRDTPEIAISPKFKVSRNSRFFTIGSCFAREIEISLDKQGISCLTSGAEFPGSFFAAERTVAANGALNVYTPASMLDLVSILSKPAPTEIGALQVGDEWCDMLLSGMKLLSREEFETAREVLLSAYRQLPNADVVIITLGYTEAWYDSIDQIYVNRSPAATTATAKYGDRYQFHNMTAPQVMECLDKIVEQVASQTGGRAKIVITTSPVPLHATFSGIDVIVANNYSKCTLVSSAQWLASKHDNVDYFPSYEFVNSMNRSQALLDDGVHVKRGVVDAIMSSFIDNYLID